MTGAALPPASGCLLCLVQASGSMRQTIADGPADTKLAAALNVAEQVLDELAVRGSNGAACLPPVDVGVVAYRSGPDRLTRFEWLLAGTSVEAPLAPLGDLRPAAAAGGGGRDGRWCQGVEPSGDAPTRAAIDYARGVLARWVGHHPGTAGPLVVHCCDGESADGPRDAAIGELTRAVPDVFVVQCLFRLGVAPSAFTPTDPVAVGDLWAMSSAMPYDDPPLRDAPPRRALLVNVRSASRVIGEIARRLWARADPVDPPPDDPRPPEPAAEPEPTAGTGAWRGSAPEPAPETEPEPEPEPAAEPESGPPPAAEPEPEPEPEPVGPPRFVARALWVPKRGNTEAQWEDGYAVDAPAGLLAVADGASDGVFTRTWVELLLHSFLARPLPLDDREAVDAWLGVQRRAWLRAIRYPELRWSLRQRVDTSCGASTFLALRLDPPDPDAPAVGPVGWTAWAVGDVCLFHVRDGRLVGTFPIEKSSDFGYTPPLYQSKPLLPTPTARVLRGELRPGDLLLLATDALSQRLMAAAEAGDPPDWARLGAVDPADWRREIEDLRDRGAIVNDDCTLLVVRLPSDEPEPVVPPASEDAGTPAEDPGGGEPPDPSSADSLQFDPTGRRFDAP